MSRKTDVLLSETMKTRYKPKIVKTRCNGNNIMPYVQANAAFCMFNFYWNL